jgi:16S rRNA processing protein RimM
MDFLSLGKIVRTHGLDGTLVVASTTDFSVERYQKGQLLYLENPNNKEKVEVHVLSLKHVKMTDYLKLEEITSIEEAEKFKGHYILINKDDAPIPEGYYRYSDLEGCAIIEEHGKKLGTVSKVEEFPAQLTLRVKRDNGRDFFVPFIENLFILKVDIANKEIHIKLMEGML